KSRKRKSRERERRERESRERESREREGRERKGRERKGRKRKDRERKGRERKGRKRKGRERKSRERESRKRKVREREGRRRKEKSSEEKIKKYDVVEEAEMDNGELILTYEPGMGWSENSLFYTVYDSFEVTNQAFKDDSVDSVLNLIQGVMVDQKGNEELKDMITYRYTRSDFEELNYSKFKEMAFGQQWRILNEADGYFIHPGIRVNL